jgi:glutaminyl-tRNA synthetase
MAPSCTKIQIFKGPGSGPSMDDYRDFIRQIIDEDLRRGKNDGRVATRFPPEPNGYLHIGHAKSICLNFGIAAEYGGTCSLRFDDTNPMKEEQEYIDSIIEDVKWLGFDWKDRLFYASDYFESMYGWAVELIEKGLAYVCDLSPADIREYRGTLTRPGRPSPWRDRPIAENLDLFRRMRKGEFPDGARVLRARIDMASPNLNLRDPVLYRILHATHPHAGDAWSLYPMYDYAHPLEDAIEGITHSICTLEFEDHRPLYDWILANVSVPCRPQQIEFARLNVTYTVLSKRKLLQLVSERHVAGWDDPRMPTISGMRRRGYTPAAIRAFCERIGVAKRDSLVDVTLLENAVREDLNRTAPRAMAVLRPLRLVIENYPEGKSEEVEAVNNPEDPVAGSRRVPFSRALYIERDDFRENPPKKFHRLSPGSEVRLRYAYIVKCVGVVKDPATGEIVEVRCTYDPATLGDAAGGGRSVKGTSHWVSADHAIDAEVRLYEPLFARELPGAPDRAAGPEARATGSETGGAGREFSLDLAPRRAATAGEDAEVNEEAEEAPGPDQRDWKADLNPASLQILRGCKVEPALAQAPPGSRWQFERQGYFCADLEDSRTGSPVFNRTVTLRDTWAKLERRAHREGS